MGKSEKAKKYNGNAFPTFSCMIPSVMVSCLYAEGVISLENSFEDLKSIGFNNLDDIDIFGGASDNKGEEKAKTSPEDILYLKRYTCPVCGINFENSTVKVGKNKLISTDTDLRPYYDIADSVNYDIVHCNNCGYTALSRFFNDINDKQIDDIKANVSSKYKKRDYSLVLDSGMALERYQLALLNAVYKKSRNGEKGYLCLKMAWIYRALKDEEKEQQYLGNAYKGLCLAYEEDKFPICGMEEPTFTYLLGDIARRLGLTSEAVRWLSMVVTSKAASSKLKDKARDVKDLIRNSN